MNRYWLLSPPTFWTIIGVLALIVLVALKSKRTGRSALYCGAVRIQGFICLLAAVLPTIATVIDELPERFQKAWAREGLGCQHGEPDRVRGAVRS